MVNQMYLDKANVLIEALPYIQRFNRKIIVIKYGGSAMVDEELKRNVIQDVVLLKLVGFKPIIVHGGGKEISRWVGKVGMEPKFVNGLRVTDADTMEVAEMVLNKVNKELVTMIQSLGVNAFGISGKDGGLLNVEKKLSKGEDIGFVGNIKNVNPKVLYDLLDNDFLPVVCPVGMDDDFNTYNINADDAACAIARAVKAEKLAFLTDVEGVYTADPRVVKNARKLDVITYDEMLELASLGAQVLNNRSVELAKKFRVDLEVLSSLERNPGTKVKEVTKVEKTTIAGVAKDTSIARIALIGLRHNPGVAFQVFDLLSKHNINVDLILQSIGREDSKDISFTVHEKDLEDAQEILTENQEVLCFDHIEVDGNIGKVSIVGAGLMTNCGMAARMFEALYEAGINIQMINTSEIRVSVLLDEGDVDRAVRAIHAKFFDEI